MATNYPTKTTLPEPTTYQQAMHKMNSILIARPGENGYVMLQPQQLTRVVTQPGQHYKLRQLGSDGKTLQTPDNVIAVRNADALHLRYADGSTASFENFFAVCTDSSVCSVNLASDDANGMTLSGANTTGGVGDDGMMVYAHGNRETLMAMAQDQDSLLSALRALDAMAVITYLPPDVHLGTFALVALGIVAAGNSAHGNGNGAAASGSGALSGTAESRALNTISAAAEGNTAGSSALAASVYATAGVTGVTSTNLTAINSALDSTPVNGIATDTRPEVQAIVDAYNAILASADGTGGNTTTPLTGAQYTAIGVTGVSGTATPGSSLFLLNNTVDTIPTADVDTVTEVQFLANAAAHVMNGAGGTAAQAGAITLTDLAALNISGVTAGNLVAIQAAIQATIPDSAIDTRAELQAIADAAITGITTALNTISVAAQNNTAISSSLAANIYAAASVAGVTASNLGAINSALDSAPVNGVAADTTAEVQAIVDAYTAILASADAMGGNTTTPLSAAQYTTIGVTGVSGTATPGSALYLLNDTIDVTSTAGVDTVPEVQYLADAAAHVLAAAGGTSAQASAVTLADLMALGIVGVTAGNLAAVQTAIQSTTPDSAIDTQAELQAVANSATGATQNTSPNLTTTLGGVTNLDVTSNIVFSVNQSVTIGTGFIHITDLGGVGYQGDTTTNTQTIDVSTAIANGLLTISGTGANTKIIINPQWDLDLASNYQITIDDGAFRNTGGNAAAVHLAPISFSTVTPGTHVSGTAATEAVVSQTMVDGTGALAAGKSWLDIQGIGNNTGSVAQLGDLSGGSYALVMKNYATVRGGDPQSGGDGSDGIATHDTNVGFTNFGNNDIVYFDSQVNNSAIQFFDARYTSVTDGASIGGLAGQNTLVMGLVPTPTQQGSTAMVLLGLEGNTANTVYPGVITLNATSIGWADVWHAASPAVIMG